MKFAKSITVNSVDLREQDLTEKSLASVSKEVAYKRAQSAHFIFLFEYVLKCTELAKNMR